MLLNLTVVLLEASVNTNIVSMTRTNNHCLVLDRINKNPVLCASNGLVWKLFCVRSHGMLYHEWCMITDQ